MFLWHHTEPDILAQKLNFNWLFFIENLLCKHSTLIPDEDLHQEEKWLKAHLYLMQICISKKWSGYILTSLHNAFKLSYWHLDRVNIFMQTCQYNYCLSTMYTHAVIKLVPMYLTCFCFRLFRLMIYHITQKETFDQSQYRTSMCIYKIP